MDTDKVDLLNPHQFGGVLKPAACRILLKVIDLMETEGCFPRDVSCEEIGQALYWITSKSNETDPLTALIKGYRDAERARNEAYLAEHV